MFSKRRVKSIDNFLISLPSRAVSKELLFLSVMNVCPRSLGKHYNFFKDAVMKAEIPGFI